ncbi:DUF6545 domain-containing protein [Streptomyces sp. PanSC9]|uniref:DUF6545 domain-containing protein n=1 Tax=Streptomyces sp. PanSC9 TaxID=1520461 RepID=UPI0011CEB8B0|nr:DUF6545 domain-containing protein [Streptomyces sp. PanSC9]
MTINFVLGGVVYAVASPLGYRTLGSVSGRPWLATLPIYVGILLCYGSMQLLTLLWAPAHPGEPQRSRRTIRAWALAYSVSVAIMCAAFLAAELEGPADPLRFNTQQADDPGVLVFLAVFLAMLTCGTLSTWHRTRQAEAESEPVEHALRWFGRSMLITFGYVVCSVPAIIAAATGHHQLDSVGVLGALFGVAGCVGTCYGMSGAAISAWLRERRDIAGLQPLWDLVVVGVDDELSFSPARSSLNRYINVRWTLHRMIIEILDGIRGLRKWATDEPAQILIALHQNCLANDAVRARYRLAPEGMPPAELEAAVTAAILRHAVRRHQAKTTQQAGVAQAATLASPQGLAAIPGAKTAAAEERRRLLGVARALDHPLVEAALLCVTPASEAEQAGGHATAPLKPHHGR